MTVRLYTSLDSGAPVLNGTAGAFIAVLKACLVTGYGALPGAGWTEEFTGTNLSVLRPGVGNRHYFRIDDTNAQYAIIKGYLAMTGVSTGTGPFPSSTAVVHMQKSFTADSTARQWIVVADERTVHIAHQWDSLSTWGKGRFYSMGDFIKLNPAWPALNSYIWAESSTITTADSGAGFTMQASFSSSTQGLVRSNTLDGLQAVSTARRYTAIQYTEGTIATILGAHGRAQPSQTTGGYTTSPIMISSISGSSGGETYTVLGRFRGIRDILHNRPLAVLDTVNGAGDLATKTFIAVLGGNPSGDQQGQLLIETSNTWED